MNNLVSNFHQVLQFAQEYGLPVEKKRAIIREYLQSTFIARLYGLSGANKLSFVGGTSLRLLRGLPRFSEDLDFDNLGLTNVEVVKLVTTVMSSLEKENIQIQIVTVEKGKKTYFTLKFPNLLFDLRISTDPREKLSIKVDYADWWQGQATEVVLFNRYGFIEQIITNKLDQVMVQKIAAYVRRKETQPRDMYDIVWLFSQGAKFDKEFAIKNNLEGLLDEALQKSQDESITGQMKRKLQPFLFDQTALGKIDLLGNILVELSK